MSLDRRLDQIQKRIAAASAIYLGETGPSLLNPSIDQRYEASMGILSTMPEAFQRLVIEDAESFFDSPDAEEFSHPITRRVDELVEYRLYGCPRPLALPAEFCRAYVECEPGHALKFNGFECEDCAFEHPLEFWYESRQERGRPLFKTCALCGGRVSYNAYANKHRRSATCHDTPGSPYRQAMAQAPPGVVLY
jgi:hypothetical protein